MAGKEVGVVRYTRASAIPSDAAITAVSRCLRFVFVLLSLGCFFKIHSHLRRMDNRSFREDDLYDLYDLYDLAHAVGWEPYNPHDFAHVFLPE